MNPLESLELTPPHHLQHRSRNENRQTEMRIEHLTMPTYIQIYAGTNDLKTAAARFRHGQAIQKNLKCSTEQRKQKMNIVDRSYQWKAYMHTAPYDDIEKWGAVIHSRKGFSNI